jgi:hypothetical protein
MTLEAMVAELQRLKGSGCWKRIAERSGSDYTTVARIARGDLKNPGILTCEAIVAAMKAETEPQPAQAEG